MTDKLVDYVKPPDQIPDLIRIWLVVVLMISVPACVTVSVEYPVLDEIPLARSDVALIFFYKTEDNHYENRYHYVYDNGQYLGAVKEGSFFFSYVEPGKHNFSCYKADFRAGQTYYLENIYLHPLDIYEPQMIMVSGNAIHANTPISGVMVDGLTKHVGYRFVPVSPSVAQTSLVDLKYATINIEGEKRGRTMSKCRFIYTPENFPKK